MVVQLNGKRYWKCTRSRLECFLQMYQHADDKRQVFFAESGVDNVYKGFAAP